MSNNWYDLILPGISGLCWTAVYLLIIIIAKRTRIHAMPLWALAINISWELIYSIVGFTKWANPQGNPIVVKAQAIMNLIWFIFDCIILVQYFMYAKKFWSEETKKWFIPWTIIAILTGFTINLAIYFEGTTTSIVVFSDKEAAILSAFLDNVMMSICFVAFAFNVKELRGQSLWIGILKLIGTLAPTIFLGFIDFGIGKFVIMAIVPGFLCLAFDVIYCVVLVKNQKKHFNKIINFKKFEIVILGK